MINSLGKYKPTNTIFVRTPKKISEALNYFHIPVGKLYAYLYMYKIFKFINFAMLKYFKKINCNNIYLISNYYTKVIQFLCVYRYIYKHR